MWYSEYDLARKLMRLGMSNIDACTAANEIKNSPIAIDKVVNGNEIALVRFGPIGEDECAYKICPYRKDI